VETEEDSFPPRDITATETIIMKKIAENKIKQLPVPNF